MALVVSLLGLVLALLGLVLLPEFLDAQRRAARSHERRDFQRLAEALERYQADQGRYPDRLENLTTPSAHLTALPTDPFNPQPGALYRYAGDHARWMIHSLGPDENDDGGQLIYDATNGTISDGDIVRVGPSPEAWSQIPSGEALGLQGPGR